MLLHGAGRSVQQHGRQQQKQHLSLWAGPLIAKAPTASQPAQLRCSAGV